jgi:hypothetical protein
MVLTCQLLYPSASARKALVRWSVSLAAIAVPIALHLGSAGEPTGVAAPMVVEPVQRAAEATVLQVPPGARTVDPGEERGSPAGLELPAGGCDNRV